MNLYKLLVVVYVFFARFSHASQDSSWLSRQLRDGAAMFDTYSRMAKRLVDLYEAAASSKAKSTIYNSEEIQSQSPSKYSEQFDSNGQTKRRKKGQKLTKDKLADLSADKLRRERMGPPKSTRNKNRRRKGKLRALTSEETVSTMAEQMSLGTVLQTGLELARDGLNVINADLYGDSGEEDDLSTDNGNRDSSGKGEHYQFGQWGMSEKMKKYKDNMQRVETAKREKAGQFDSARNSGKATDKANVKSRLNPNAIRVDHSLSNRVSADQRDVASIECNRTWTQTAAPSASVWHWTPWLQCANGTFGANVTAPQRWDSNSELQLYSTDCRMLLSFNTLKGRLELTPSMMTAPMIFAGLRDNVTVETNDTYYALFTALNGDVEIYKESTDELVFSLSANDSDWKNESLSAEGDYTLDVHNSGSMHIFKMNDSGSLIGTRWYKSNDGDKNKRIGTYAFNATNSSLSGLTFEVIANVANSDELWVNAHINSEDWTQWSVGARLSVLVTVFELTADPFGDYYSPTYGPLTAAQTERDFHVHMQLAADYYAYQQVYDWDIIGGWNQIDLHAINRGFLCRQSEAPLSFGIAFQPLNGSLVGSEEDIWQLTIDMNPWNGCGYGWPVNAYKKSERTCAMANDTLSAFAQLKKANHKAKAANGSAAYSQLKASVDDHCAADLVATFENVTSADDCVDYYSHWYPNGTRVVNPFWFSEDCVDLRSQCLYFYQICYDYFAQQCTCYCPRDRKGNFCQESRSFTCEIEVMNANMDDCAAMTQSQLNAHGRDDYDVSLDGDKPCFFVEANGDVNSHLRMDCSFDKDDDAQGGSQVWERQVVDWYQIDYNSSMGNRSFEYCVGAENASFALSIPPPESYARVKIFNFKRVFNNSEEFVLGIGVNDWSGDGNLTHTRSLTSLHSDYKLGGRIYFEYQLWSSWRRLAVARRFYDIDHWKMPVSNELTEANIAAIVGGCVAVVVLALIVWKCVKWCQALDHQKID